MESTIPVCILVVSKQLTPLISSIKQASAGKKKCVKITSQLTSLRHVFPEKWEHKTLLPTPRFTFLHASNQYITLVCNIFNLFLLGSVCNCHSPALYTCTAQLSSQEEPPVGNVVNLCSAYIRLKAVCYMKEVLWIIAQSASG